MPERKFNRREFLKIAVTTAAAAGLSHFRFLNVGGARVAYAQDECTNDPSGPPDLCEPQINNPDTCPEPIVTPADLCGVTAGDPVDFCEPTAPPAGFGEPDTCDAISPDICDPTDDPSDDCVAAADTCELTVPLAADTCGTDDPDACDPNAPANPDVCVEPAGSDRDVCYPPAEEDTCPTGGPDTCQGVTTPETPDICDPGTNNPDTPNPVTISDLAAGPLSSGLPALGGAVAALGAAALWLRRHLRPAVEEAGEPEEESDTD